MSYKHNIFSLRDICKLMKNNKLKKTDKKNMSYKYFYKNISNLFCRINICANLFY